MTQSEARNIESTCDQILTDNTEYDCYCSMALAAHLRVQFGENCITISKKDLHTPVWFSFSGYWKDLDGFINQIQKCIENNRILFERLMWSYEHCNELAEE